MAKRKASKEERGPDVANQQKKPIVLVADDERVIADTLAIILNQHGFESCGVHTSEEEIERARVLRPDFIISDFGRPGLNGAEAAIHSCE